VEAFPVLVAMFEKILGECPYKSPTDMGVNMVGNCIVDDDAVRAASAQEIVRRYYDARCEQKKGKVSDDVVFKLELLMKKAGVTPEIRRVVAPALERAEKTSMPAAAMELPDGLREGSRLSTAQEYQASSRREERMWTEHGLLRSSHPETCG
jgi:uncharacterized protein (UPF0371 family)